AADAALARAASAVEEARRAADRPAQLAALGRARREIEEARSQLGSGRYARELTGQLLALEADAVHAGTPPATGARGRSDAPAAAGTLAATAYGQGQAAASLAPPVSAGGYLPVTAPDVPTLPWELVDGVKVYRLRVEPLKREFAPGWTFDVWGYNGSMPGPTIE